MKIATVKLGWKRSASTDVIKTVVKLVNDGVETSSEFGPEVEEMIISVAASKAVHFSVISVDSEGQSTESATYDFVLGDLEAPQPATDLFHEIIEVRDSPDSPD